MGLLAIFCTVNGDRRLPAALLRLALAESTAFFGVADESRGSG